MCTRVGKMYQLALEIKKRLELVYTVILDYLFAARVCVFACASLSFWASAITLL